MEPLSLYGWFVQKVRVSCFSDSFVHKTTHQKGASAKGSLRTGGKMTAVMLQVNPSFYTNDKICFLPNCRYHIILIGNIKELLQKLDAFCFNYRHVDCLYTLFKYRFSGKIVLKSGQLFDNLQRAVHFNQQNRGVGRMPSIANKGLLRKKFKKHLLSSFQKTKSRKLVHQCLQTESNKLKRLKLK